MGLVRRVDAGAVGELAALCVKGKRETSCTKTIGRLKDACKIASCDKPIRIHIFCQNNVSCKGSSTKTYFQALEGITPNAPHANLKNNEARRDYTLLLIGVILLQANVLENWQCNLR